MSEVVLLTVTFPDEVDDALELYETDMFVHEFVDAHLSEINADREDEVSRLDYMPVVAGERVRLTAEDVGLYNYVHGYVRGDDDLERLRDVTPDEVEVEKGVRCLNCGETFTTRGARMTHLSRRRCDEIDDEDDELATMYAHELADLKEGVERLKSEGDT